MGTDLILKGISFLNLTFLTKDTPNRSQDYRVAKSQSTFIDMCIL